MIKIDDAKYFVCDECPICENFERIIELAKELGCKPQLNYCGCDKIQYEFWLGGYCSDAHESFREKEKRGSRYTGSAYRRKMDRLKNSNRSNRIDYARSNGAGYITHEFVDGDWKMTGNHIIYPSNSRRQRFYKKYSNKKVRRNKYKIPNGNYYRRMFDYKWEIH